MKTWLIAVPIAILGIVGLSVTSAVAQTESAVGVAASVNGQDVAFVDQDHPVYLDPSGAAQVEIVLMNNSAEVVSVSSVDLSGHVLGLSFFDYHSSMAATVEPGETQTIAYAVDLSGLDGQATGLINGSLTLLDGSGQVIVDIPIVTDVRGSLISVYGLFGLALAMLTVLALLDTVLAIARNRMPQNRWRRGLRFLTPGIGIGLVLVFTLSALRVWVPTTERWLVVAAAFAVGFFFLGYLTPTPLDEDELGEDEEDYEGELDEAEWREGAERTRRDRPTVPTQSAQATLPDIDRK
ncbi:hypothetical protein [Rhodococcus maanshanensis]|uniref:DUF4436 domain-containing protein n=1 Tax=Rhodococcus maanshanensis TaxID=183556 RepID=A0A1H7RG62_9NOCA|nr:hypothetical protein [Rhodococcus maanshanensis]SEL59162.1 hypothetical protein SAMN05444583_11182 [Rhodococcus maanshanensis]